MKVLFFAVNNHHLKYFRKIAEVADDRNEIQTRVIRHRSIWPYAIGIPVTEFTEIKQLVDLHIKKEELSSTKYNISNAKKKYLKISFHLKFTLLFNAYSRFFSKITVDYIAVWGGLKGHQSIAVAAAKNAGISIIYMENGPLPQTTAVDTKGINFNNSLPRDIKFYRENGKASPSLPTQLQDRNLHKDRKETEKNIESLPSRYIFIPFQVDDDSQILSFSPWIQNMTHLYEVLDQIIPNMQSDMFFIIKEHPSSSRSYSHLHQRNPRIKFANSQSTQNLIENAEAVITINSTVGLESMLFGKPVITLGQAFYSMDGLTYQAGSVESLEKLLKSTPAPATDHDYQAYLGYIYDNYLIKGSWKNADLEHINYMIDRILSFN
jgi:capsular polysaccharide export protein